MFADAVVEYAHERGVGLRSLEAGGAPPARDEALVHDDLLEQYETLARMAHSVRWQAHQLNLPLDIERLLARPRPCSRYKPIVTPASAATAIQGAWRAWVERLPPDSHARDRNRKRRHARQRARRRVYCVVSGAVATEDLEPFGADGMVHMGTSRRLEPATEVVVLETSETSAGQLRGRTVHGWVSFESSAGVLLLQHIDDVEPPPAAAAAATASASTSASATAPRRAPSTPAHVVVLDHAASKTRFEVQALFDAYDADGSGELDRDEMATLAEDLGIELDETELDNAMLQMDSDGNGTVSFFEFYSWWRVNVLDEPLQPNDPQYVRALFDTFDADNSGTLDVFEIRGLCRSLGHELSDGELTDVLREMDHDRNSVADFDEFYRWWSSKDDQALLKATLRELFVAHDADGNGTLDAAELRAPGHGAKGIRETGAGGARPSGRGTGTAAPHPSREGTRGAADARLRVTCAAPARPGASWRSSLAARTRSAAGRARRPVVATRSGLDRRVLLASAPTRPDRSALQPTSWHSVRNMREAAVSCSQGNAVTRFA